MAEAIRNIIRRTKMTRQPTKFRQLPRIEASITIKTNKQGHITKIALKDAINQMHNALCTITKYQPKYAKPVKIFTTTTKGQPTINIWWEGTTGLGSRLSKFDPNFHNLPTQKDYRK